MATILLAAAGAALGSGFGGTVLGISGAVIGRAVGATVGRTIDQKLLGGGSEAVDVGRIDRFRLMGASEGAAVARVWGRVRVPGQVIWATRFQEHHARTGGKGAPKPRSATYSYTISLAIAVCEGVVSRIGRVWADGNEIAPGSLDMRVYKGSEDQLPDPKIQAVEGVAETPAYRGIAYVVIENLALAAYGNRVPQFSFEVIRPAQGNLAAAHPDLSKTIKGVCLIPGTGEYALATTPVHYNLGLGKNRSANANTVSGKTDFATSFEQLQEELPQSKNVSLVISWFGDDLRCSSCEIRPKVEQTLHDGVGMPWTVNGLSRSAAQVVPQMEGRPIYGGTPTDQSVVEAIGAIHAAGQEVTFYPFILNQQLEGNSLADPWSDLGEQPALPWRGRITLNVAPGRSGSTDRSAGANSEVETFFGTAQPAHFSISSGAIAYTGPTEWSYRRFILHYAMLCKMAGGVDAFCIGSEMRSLTQIRGEGDSFPTVSALCQLAQDVRQILGTATRIGYAADWSEYFGFHAGGNIYFHLDTLWAHPEINFVGIDNYMPVTDWRDGETHTDVIWGDIHNVDYIRSNIAGGEGFDWYYDGPEGEALQLRRPIIDTVYGEHWVFRFKDIKAWWSQLHFNRIGGVKEAGATAWVPESKPIIFTEYGCAAIDKGSNQPNKFFDKKSSESGAPRHSNGNRDDLIQLSYFTAIDKYWADALNNPISQVYGAAMLDVEKCTAWAWDARPYPDFPGNAALWSDTDNYLSGHWLNGRSSNQVVAAIVSEICEAAGNVEVDTQKIYGLARGFNIVEVGSARAELQPLLMAFGISSFEFDGTLIFETRDCLNPTDLQLKDLVSSGEIEKSYQTARSADIEVSKRVRIAFVEAETSFSVRNIEVAFPGSTAEAVTQSELPLVLTEGEAVSIAERWISEAQVSQTTIRIALPRSRMDINSGDVFTFEGDRFRVEHLEQSEYQVVDAVKVNTAVLQAGRISAHRPSWAPYFAPVPVSHQFLDLPILIGSEVPFAPHIGVLAMPWLGSIGVWDSVSEEGFRLNVVLDEPAVLGTTETELLPCASGVWDRGPALRVNISFGAFASESVQRVFSGENTVAIGDGSSSYWEVFQFLDASLVSPGTYDLFYRLRGQVGTDCNAGLVWPIGSKIVLLSSSLKQIYVPGFSLGLSRNYIFNALDQAPTDSGGSSIAAEAFDGVGLRPYSVSHVGCNADSLSGGLVFKWIRRTRIGGDSWSPPEVPLSEEVEAYDLTISRGDLILRRESINATSWLYSDSMQLEDGAFGQLLFSVAQYSPNFGAGPYRTCDFFV